MHNTGWSICTWSMCEKIQVKFQELCPQNVDPAVNTSYQNSKRFFPEGVCRWKKVNRESWIARLQSRKVLIDVLPKLPGYTVRGMLHMLHVASCNARPLDQHHRSLASINITDPHHRSTASMINSIDQHHRSTASINVVDQHYRST